MIRDMYDSYVNDFMDDNDLSYLDYHVSGTMGGIQINASDLSYDEIKSLVRTL